MTGGMPNLSNEDARSVYAILMVQTADGSIGIRFVKAPDGITDAVQRTIRDMPGCKIKIYEKSHDRSYFQGNLDAVWKNAL